jgi:integrase
MAYSWKLIDRVPLIHLLRGERSRTFVLSRKEEAIYLGFARQPLKDVATLILDGGQRLGEILRLTWNDVDFHGTDDAPYGYLHIRVGKSKNAKRSIPMSRRVRVLLELRKLESSFSDLVFPDKCGREPISAYTLRDQHASIRQLMKLQKTDFVIHSLRHTCLTRLGENKVDIFTLKTLAGHSSVVVTQRYVTTSEAAKGAAILGLEIPAKGLPEGAPKALPATIPATVSGEQVDALQHVI